jgi:hypothetical protein
MPEERRFSEDEVAEIFESAATARTGPGGALSRTEGLTLSELQAIGREVGMAPERIAEAAAALDIRRESARRSDFGMPVSVRRVVDLPRAPTDREWEMLVADLRETFNAKGRESSRGEIREWNNGNLHAYVEPTATGYRLRMGTTKGEAAGLNRFGAFSLVLALVMLAVFAAQGRLGEEFMVPIILGLMGTLAVGSNALRLPGWAEEREAQMERVGARAVSLLGAGPSSRALPEGSP